MLQKRIRLGDLLVEKGLITNEQLMHCLKIQKSKNYVKKLGEILVDEGFVTKNQIFETLSKQLGIDFIDLFGEELNFKLLGKFPLKLLENANAIPFKEDDEFIHIATSDPLNYDALEALETSAAVFKPIKLYISMPEDIRQIFTRIEIREKTRLLAKEVKEEIKNGGNRDDNLEESAVLQLIRTIIRDAISKKASDLHIEPDAHEMSVRCRIDGILKETFVFDLEVYTALNSRIKILGNLDISERRRAQDGRFSMQIDGGNYDFRLSTTPTLFGESIVMRILDQQKILLKMNELGFIDQNLQIFQDTIRQPYGIVLITGPTGSGKTTTLYAALNEIKSIENKVLTIEDPIEYQLPLVQQVQVNEKVDFSFAKALRSFLRQDPDVIMVGEIRDIETLSAATQASLTGHLVFSTLHTNDAPSTINRMVQMGLEPFLISDALIAIVAQRLVRKMCPYCKEEYKPNAETLNKVQGMIPEGTIFYKGRGCPKCDMSGFSGRVVIAEILKIDDKVAKVIARNGTKQEISDIAEKEGLYSPMINDGIQKVLQGITTLEEVLRVVRR